jgi:hypothetical protein
MRDEGILRAADVRVRGVRMVLEATAIEEMFLDSVAGHLLNAPNMLDSVIAEVRRCRQGSKDVAEQSISILW